MPTQEEIIKLINDFPELDLPNGAKGAIWKEDLIYELNKLYATNTTPARKT